MCLSTGITGLMFFIAIFVPLHAQIALVALGILTDLFLKIIAISYVKASECNEQRRLVKDVEDPVETSETFDTEKSEDSQRKPFNFRMIGKPLRSEPASPY